MKSYSVHLSVDIEAAGGTDARTQAQRLAETLGFDQPHVYVTDENGEEVPEQ